MTLNRDVELLLRAHFDERGDRTVGDGQVASILDRVATHRQRPAWLAALRSPFMTATAIARPAAPRAAWILAVGILAGLLIGAALFVGTNLPKAQPVNGLIVFGRFDDALGDTVVHVVNPDGSDVRQLRPEVYEGPYWSPDGKLIALDGNVIDADGSNLRVWDTTDDPISLYCWDWSPDGQRMLCEGWSDVVGEEDIHGIYTMRASDGGDLVRLSVPGDVGVPGTYSPDGSMIAYVGTFEGVAEALIVVNVDGTNRHRVGTLGAIRDPRWAPDGESLLVGRNGILYSIDVATGAPTPFAIREGLNRPIASGQWSPDGTRILFRGLIEDENWDLFTMLPDGTDVVQVTNNPDDDRFFDWGTHPIED
jgi:TolB protein